MDVDVVRSPLSVEDRARLISDVFNSDDLDGFEDLAHFKDDLLAELRLAESLAELNAPDGMDVDADGPPQPQLPVVPPQQHADRGALRDGLGLG